MKTLTTNQAFSVAGGGLSLLKTSMSLLAAGSVLTGIAGQLSQTEIFQDNYSFRVISVIPFCASLALTGAGLVGVYLAGYEDGNNKKSNFLNNAFDNGIIQVTL